MAVYIPTFSVVNLTSNGLDMGNVGDLGYIGPNIIVGSRAENGYGVFGNQSGQSLVVAGGVAGYFGVSLIGANARVEVQGSGSVAGFNTCVYFGGGGGGALSNAGAISGGSGVVAAARLDVTNSGSVSARGTAIDLIGGGFVTNTGLVTGVENAVSAALSASFLSLFNSGTIVGAVRASNAADTFINQGVMNGFVVMNGGNDAVDGTGGRFLRVVDLGAGDDTFIGGDFADQVIGGVGQDDLFGGGGNDIFRMDDSVDTDGSDDIDGGAGTDTYDASGLNFPPAYVNLATGLAKILGDTDTLTSIERVAGSGQDDTLIGDGLANILIALIGADSLSGGGGSDRLLGGDGNDSLFGGDGNDRLVGDAGRDVLNGGAGTDVVRGGLDIDFMTGSTGSDRFVWTDFQDFLPTALNPAAGIDRVTDFTQGQDQIDLSAIDALATGLDDAFVFAGTGALTALGQISYRTTATTTIISISFDAIQGFDVIRLDGVIALTAADFVL